MTERVQRSQVFPGCDIRLGGGEEKVGCVGRWLASNIMKDQVGFRQTTFVYTERRLYRENVHVQVWKRNRDAEQRHEHSGRRVLQRPCGLHTAWAPWAGRPPWSLVYSRRPAGLTDLTWHGFPISSFLIPADFSRILSPSVYLTSPFPDSGPLVLRIKLRKVCG